MHMSAEVARLKSDQRVLQTGKQRDSILSLRLTLKEKNQEIAKQQLALNQAKLRQTMVSVTSKVGKTNTKVGKTDENSENEGGSGSTAAGQLMNRFRPNVIHSLSREDSARAKRARQRARIVDKVREQSVWLDVGKK
eukprot:333177_1